MTQDGEALSRNVGLLINLATTGGFGALVWYLITRHIPAQNRESRADAAVARTAFIEALERSEESHREEISELRALTREMIDLAQRHRREG